MSASAIGSPSRACGVPAPAFDLPTIIRDAIRDTGWDLLPELTKTGVRCQYCVNDSTHPHKPRPQKNPVTGKKQRVFPFKVRIVPGEPIVAECDDCGVILNFLDLIGWKPAPEVSHSEEPVSEVAPSATPAPVIVAPASECPPEPLQADLSVSAPDVAPESVEAVEPELFASIPSVLMDYPQWVLWKLETRNGKTTKPPYLSESVKAKTDDSATWLSFESALQNYRQGGFSGIGFVFTKDDPFVGIDLDHCVDADGGLTPEATEILSLLGSTYCELSPSGTGLHFIATGSKPKGECKRNGVEIYDHGRYFTVTGKPFGSVNPIVDCTEAIAAVHARFITAPVKVKADEHRERGVNRPADIDDSALIDKAMSAVNGAKFATLWAGNTEGDHSVADQSLCAQLAFWTNHDADRMDRLFRQSGLMRDKWDEVHSGDGRTYGAMTIDKAISGVPNGYEGKRQGQEHSSSYKPTVEPVRPVLHGRSDDSSLAKLAHTDMGLADRLVARYGEDLRYCRDFGKWLIWDGTRWQMERNGDAMLRAKDTARSILNEAATVIDKSEAKALAAFAFKSQSRERLNSMLCLSQCELPVVPEELDQYPMLLNVKNGVIDLRTGNLKPHNREHLITKQANVAYDPKAQCPVWSRTIDRIFDGDSETIAYVQKALGYSISGNTGAQCFFVCYGTGRNGKSTILEVVSGLLSSDYAQQAAPELLMAKKQDRHPTEVADLRGARFVSAVETKEGGRLNEPLLKQMTGGDRVKARFMNQDFFEFKPEFKLWLATNHKPTIKGTDLGIWRRIRLIPFNVQIPENEVDFELGEKLKLEYAGILNWLLAGCLMWQFEGLKPPIAVQDATGDYQVEQDALADFLSDRVIVKHGDRLCCVSAGDLYETYVSWCKESGEFSLTQRELGMRLRERGFSKDKTNGKNLWRGLTIRK